MTRKHRTELQKLYQKQRRRLQQAVRRGIKQGYIFNEDVIPAMPKRVTKQALKKIESTKPNDLYKNATWLDIETGEIIPALEKRKEKRSRKKRNKKEATDIVIDYPKISLIDSLKNRIENMTSPQIFKAGTKGKIEYPIENRKNYLLQIIDDAYDFYGDDYIKHLEQNSEEIFDLIDSVMYKASDTEQIDATFARLGRLLNVTSLNPTQAENLSYMSEMYN